MNSAFDAFYKTLDRFPVLSSEEETRLVAQYKANGCTKARDQIVSAHMRLVASFARALPGTDADRMDSVQDGAIGLLKALDEFDAHRGLRFSALASEWIRRSILKGNNHRNRGMSKREDVDLNDLQLSAGEEHECARDLQLVLKTCATIGSKLPRVKRSVLKLRMLSENPPCQRIVARRLRITQPEVSKTERSILSALRGQLRIKENYRRRVRSRNRGPHAVQWSRQTQ